MSSPMDNPTPSEPPSPIENFTPSEPFAPAVSAAVAEPPAPAKKSHLGRNILISVVLLALIIVGAGATLFALGRNGVGPLTNRVRQPTIAPQFTKWSATTNDPTVSFTFTLTPNRRGVSDLFFTFIDYSCGIISTGEEIDGITNLDSSQPIAAITNSAFTDTENLDLGGFGAPASTLKISGAFDATGKHASGSLTITDPDGTACPATWTATGS